MQSATIGMIAEEQAHGHAFLALPVLIGLGAAIWFAMPSEPSAGLLSVAFLFSLGFAFILRGTYGRFRSVVLIAVLLTAGMLLAAFQDWRRSTVVLDQPVTTVVTGVVEMREPSGEGRWRYVLALESTASPQLRRPPTRITLLSRTRQPAFDIGDRIGGRARISPPSGPALPGLVDFAFSSYYDGIGAIGFFYGAPTLMSGPVAETWAQTLERTVFAWRSAIASRIRATVPGDPGAFAAAIVTDERRAISDETTEALRVSGLAHIVAISGLNMALAAGIFFIGMRSLLALLPGFAQAFPVKKLAAAAALLMATGYYLTSGFGVSAERAYIMMAIMLAAVFFDRPSISLRNVALAALVVLVVSPSEILGPSFQMSFAATVALVAGYSAWSRRGAAQDGETPWRPAALKPVLAIGHLAGGVFATSLIGGLSTAIFSIDHFHRISTYGLAANLAAMPLVSFIVMPFGLIGMLLMPFGLDGFFLKVMGVGLEGVIVVAKMVATWGGDVAIGRQPSWFLPVATAGFLMLTLLRTRLHLLGLPLLALAIFLSWRVAHDPPPDFLVSEDGSLAALLGNKQVATNRARPPGFIYSQWRHALSLPQPAAPTLLDTPSPKNGTTTSAEVAVLLPNGAAVPKTADGLRSVSTSMGGEQQATALREANAPKERATSRRPPLTPEEVFQARQAMQKALRESVLDTFVCAGRSWCVARTTSGPAVAVVEDARFAGPACDVAQMVVAARARFDRCRSGALMINGEALRRTGALEIRFNGNSDPKQWSIAAAMVGADRSWTRHRDYDWRRNLFDPTLPEPLRFLSGKAGISGNGE
ncbi:ComEC/Rec2 family competence protein [Neorhizobium sp. BT27B]